MSASRAACAAIACAALLSACDNAPLSDRPPEMHFGSDVCAACSMIISDERFAAAMIAHNTADEPVVLRFDDAGEMLAYEAGRPQLTILKRWLKDAQTRDWLEAEQAWLIRSPSLHTPMGTGVAAAASREQAKALAEDISDADATPMRYAEMIKQAREQD